MWPRPPVTERRDPDGYQTRVGYILRRGGFERHCGIVSRICFIRGGRRGEAATLLTASRDATLKCWDIPANETHGGASSSTAPPPAQLRCSLEEHTAWVNDAVVLPVVSGSAHGSRDSRRIVSASNDNLVKVWQVDEDEKQGAGVIGALLSLRYHIDYVTCLAYAPHRSLLASAGLDARAVVADLEAATRILNLPVGDNNDSYSSSGASHRSASTSAAGHRGGPGPPAASVAQRCTVGQFSGAGQYIPQLLVSPGTHVSSRDGAGYDHGRAGYGEDVSASSSTTSSGASVWSLAATRSASLLACGTASCAVRGWDPRSGVRLWRLKGHTENVRALVLSDDGTICISGSADRTVRVWDLGMRRCVHIFDAHHDSVWALAVAGCSCGYASQGVADTAGAGGMLSEVFSGGRDGLVLAHDLRLMQTGLVVREPSALQAIAVPPDGMEVWASAADSHVRRHSVPGSLVPYGSSSPLGAEAVPPPGAAPSPMPALPPAASDDCVAIPGTPPLTDYKVLDNKRQVLVKDACDQLSLWDVTNGQYVDFPTPSTPSGSGKKEREDVMKRALFQINRPVSVPNWFSCDLSLGSLSVYLDVFQCFKAEPDDGDLALPTGNTGAGARGLAVPGGGHSTSNVNANLGTRTLRALFENWVRMPVNGQGRGAGGERVYGANGRAGATTTPRGRPASARPRIFIAPPQLPEDASGARRWDDDQPPGTPADQAGPSEPPSGGSSSSSFPPATALVFVGRHGRTSSYRGRLYCGFFNGSEAPELLPNWVVDVVWNQRPPPEELCGERTLVFSFARCPSEVALPTLPTPYCVATPRTRIRRLMGFLVQALDFDWSMPAKTAARKSSSAASLVTRLGRCCVVPAPRGGRASSSDSWGGQPDVGPTALGNYHGSTSSVVSNTRRSFGLRRSDDDAAANGSIVGRVRIDGSPAPLPSVPAQAPGSNRRGAAAANAAPSAAAPPDERCVEILCNDMPVDPEMSLATVRDFVWKKPNAELVLCYRRAARAVAPPPSSPAAAGGNGQEPAGSAVAGSNLNGDDRVSEDVTSELRLNGADTGVWGSGQGSESAADDTRDPGAAPKE